MDYSLLKLDIDIPAEYFEYVKISFISSREWFLRALGHEMTDFEIKESVSGHIHVKIWFKPPASDDFHLNLLQFLLGDSHYRSYMNMKRIFAGMNRWNKLFVEKRRIDAV